MKLAVGCAGFLLALAVVTLFVDRLAGAALPPELRYFVVGAAGLCLTFGLSNAWSLMRGYGRGSRSRGAVLERARRGEVPVQDGSIVVTGTVRAEGQTLRAPLSGAECVAYQYRLYYLRRRSKGGPDEVPVYWGYACRPFRVDSPTRAFRIVAVPQLGDDAAPHDSTESKARAKSYVASTRFEPMQAMAGVLSTVATTFKELRTEPSGEVRRDWRAEGNERDVDSLLMDETVVPVNATVSVSGRWSAARQAIVPGELSEGALGVTLVTGDAEKLGTGGASELPWSAWRVALTGALFLAAGAALVWLSITGRLAEWWRAS